MQAKELIEKLNAAVTKNHQLLFTESDISQRANVPVREMKVKGLTRGKHD